MKSPPDEFYPALIASAEAGLKEITLGIDGLKKVRALELQPGEHIEVVLKAVGPDGTRVERRYRPVFTNVF